MYYLLKDKRPVPCDLMTWAAGFEENRRIAWTKVKGGHVSTIFLGLDHSFGNGAPLLFETMAFLDSGKDDYQRRYTTYEKAEVGHNALVKKLGGALAQGGEKV